LVLAFTYFFQMSASQHDQPSPKVARIGESAERTRTLTPLRVAFIGNSFTYQNDLPHLVQEQLREIVPGSVEVGACLKGGSSLTSLWNDGADMQNAMNHIGCRDMFDTVEALLSAPGGWDVVLLQDYSQGPARPESRQQSMETLRSRYIPAITAMQKNSGKKPLVMLFVSWGYLRATKRSEEIGDFTTMTRELAAGYLTYASLLESAGLATAILNVGAAFEALHDRHHELWTTLYQPDCYHIRPKATFLVACLFTIAIRQQPRFKRFFSGDLPIKSIWPEAACIYKPPGLPDLHSAKLDDPGAQRVIALDREQPSHEDLLELLGAVGVPTGIHFGDDSKL